jgi:hypothetical protein
MTQIELQSTGKAADSGSHWSKDYVEHLRTVHFSLIALSLAAIVLATAPGRDEITKARAQLSSIRELTRIWDVKWFTSTIDGIVHEIKQKGQFSIERPSESLFVLDTKFPEVDHFRSQLTVKWTADDWIVDGPAATDKSHAGIDDLCSQTEISPKAPTSLKQFQELWDRLSGKNQIVFPGQVSNTMYHLQTADNRPLVPDDVDRDRAWYFVQLQVEDFSASAQELTLHVERVLDKYNGKLYEATSSYVFSMAGYSQSGIERFYVPIIAAHSYDFNAQEILLSHFAKDRPVGGDFAHSFPELDKYTKGFQTLELDYFDSILEAEQNRTGETFEAFGIKFPAEATTRWGIVVILAVQLYFWIHLKELAKKLEPNDPGWEVAFIGMYTSWPSQLVYNISSLGLPLVAVFALSIRGLYVGRFHWLYWLLLVVGCFLTLTLTAMTWRSRPVRSEIQNPSRILMDSADVDVSPPE